MNRWVGVWPDVEPGAQSRGPNEEGLEGHPKGVSFHSQSDEQPPKVQTEERQDLILWAGAWRRAWRRANFLKMENYKAITE